MLCEYTLSFSFRFSLLVSFFFRLSLFLTPIHTRTHVHKYRVAEEPVGQVGGGGQPHRQKKIPKRQEYFFAPPQTSWTKATDVIFHTVQKSRRERQMTRIYLRGQQNIFFNLVLDLKRKRKHYFIAKQRNSSKRVFWRGGGRHRLTNLECD